MKINWKVRFANPVFWVQIALAIFTPALTYFGINAQDLTTWGSIGGLMLKAISNPVVVVSMIISITSCINDPTTKGLSDSAKALSYKAPN